MWAWLRYQWRESVWLPVTVVTGGFVVVATVLGLLGAEYDRRAAVEDAQRWNECHGRRHTQCLDACTEARAGTEMQCEFLCRND